MSTKYKFNNKSGVYFVSFATVGWIDVFPPTHKPTLHKTRRVILCPRINNEVEQPAEGEGFVIEEDGNVEVKKCRYF